MALLAGLGLVGMVAVWLGLVVVSVGALLVLAYGSLRLLRPAKTA